MKETFEREEKILSTFAVEPADDELRTRVLTPAVAAWEMPDEELKTRVLTAANAAWREPTAEPVWWRGPLIGMAASLVFACTMVGLTKSSNQRLLAKWQSPSSAPVQVQPVAEFPEANSYLALHGRVRATPSLAAAVNRFRGLYTGYFELNKDQS